MPSATAELRWVSAVAIWCHKCSRCCSFRQQYSMHLPRWYCIWCWCAQCEHLSVSDTDYPCDLAFFDRAKHVLFHFPIQCSRAVCVSWSHHVMLAYPWNPIASLRPGNRDRCCTFNQIDEKTKLIPMNSSNKQLNPVFIAYVLPLTSTRSPTRKCVAWIGVPGVNAAPGDTIKRPNNRVGITPESLNRPQYSRVNDVGSTHSAPTSRHPNLV